MDKLEYKSTRNEDKKVSASQAIVDGLSPDGGLYIPDTFENISFDLNELKDLSYRDLTKKILTPFLSDFTTEQIDFCVENAYGGDKFDISELVEVTANGDSYFLELWHGPTAAFKDMALTLLPYLLTTASENVNETKKIVILTATSGDTGKAALEGFKNVDNTEIIVFYPNEGVSYAQETQMITTEGENVHVISVNGNFDDTQNGVKEIFNDLEFNNELADLGFVLSSANSINIGRLLPQIVYYYYTYFRLVKEGRIKLGDEINFIVPSGNFGDILAGYYAKKTGLPVKNLICASNKNNILTDFFKTGEYNTNRTFYKTTSPSMDILISSNLERLLYDKLQNSVELNQLMNNLKKEGSFNISPDLFEEFLAEYATEDEVKEIIRETYQDYGNVIDPHTAVGEVVRIKLDEKLDKPSVVLATASPYKFPKTVFDSITHDNNNQNELKIQEELEDLTETTIPVSLEGLKDKEILHNLNCNRDQMKQMIKEILKNE